MKLIRRTLSAAACLVLVAAVAAQERDHDWYYHEREARYAGSGWRGRLFWKVREDLDHVQSVTFPFGRDEYRIERTKQELSELQDELTAHRYVERQLDEVIFALKRVVADNRLWPLDRDALRDDIHRLHEYREHHDSWRW